MKYALIGLGFISQRHRDAIRDIGGELILTCDVDLSKNPDFFDYMKMLQSDKFRNEVDAVIIATPNDWHKPMIKACLATGKRVLCEKPLIIDDDFEGLEGVNVVLQLRYHKLLPKIQKVLTSNDKVELIMRVYRDQNWWNSWRADEKRSGGILMGLAIHMFDLLIYLWGNNYVVQQTYNSPQQCTGIIKFPRAIVNYLVEIMDTREGQTRKLVINGQEFELCDKDNLSFAGYHDRVHEEFIKGNGIPLTEARKSIELINEIKKLGIGIKNWGICDIIKL